MRAQGRGIADANSFAKVTDEGRLDLVLRWREAIVAQMLTPAPDRAAVTWKKAALKAGEWRHVGANRSRLEQAIEVDIEWLAAHPTRKSIAATKANTA